MIMNETTRSYLWWVAAIGTLILPPVLVRTTQSGGFIRIVAYIILVAALLALCLFLGLRKGKIVDKLPIAKNLKTDQGKNTAEFIFRGIPLIIALVIIV